MAQRGDERAARKSKSIESAQWIVRPMCHDDIPRCLEIWRQVELTEARQTVASNLTTDPNGFYVAELATNGRVIGMCAGPMTRSDTAFMGFYAVDPVYQGIGIGRELWSKTISRFDESINVGLYGVPTMTEKYKKSGFKLEDSIRMLIYESIPDNSDKLQLNLLKDIDDLSDCCLETIDWQTSEQVSTKLIEYDEKVQFISREKLLKNYLLGHDVPLTLAIVRSITSTDRNKSPDCQTKVTSDSQQQEPVKLIRGQGPRKLSCCAKPGQESIIEDETLSSTIRGSLSISENNIDELQARSTSPIDIPTVSSNYRSHKLNETSSKSYSNPVDIEIVGYGCIRNDNTSGAIIGPIYADTPDICEVLLKNLLVRYNLELGAKYSVMSLTSNDRASEILRKIGLVEIDQCSRMFTKFIPTASLSRIFYVHSPNFTLF